MKSKKTKVLFIFHYSEHINSYFNRSILQKISEVYDIQILLPTSFKPYVPSEFQCITHYLDENLFTFNKNKLYLCFEISAWRSRKKSVSFKYREKKISRPYTFMNLLKVLDSCIKSVLGSKKLNRLNEKEPTDFSSDKINSKNKAPLSLIRNGFWVLIRRAFIRILSHNPFFVLVERFIFRSISVPSGIYSFIRNCNPSLIIYVSTGFEPMAYHIPKISDLLKKPSLMIADNWDNLSSKTAMWVLPSFVATWGPQSSIHAVNIQGFKPTRVFNIGTARFENYFNIRRSKIKSQYNFRYVLFIGTSLYFNERECLEILNQEIQSKPELYGKLKIVYRPHPFAQNKESASKFKDFDNVILDLQIKSILGQSTKTHPKIDYLPSLICNSELVIGGLSSVLIEASILGKKYLGLIHKEKFNLTSPYLIYKNYEHLKEIKMLPNLFLCEKLENLGKVFESVWNSKDIEQSKIDSNLAYFYELSEDSYVDKLTRVINLGLITEN